MSGYLRHFGVLGMKWGVRKEYEPHPRKRARKEIDADTYQRARKETDVFEKSRNRLKAEGYSDTDISKKFGFPLNSDSFKFLSPYSL